MSFIDVRSSLRLFFFVVDSLILSDACISFRLLGVLLRSALPVITTTFHHDVDYVRCDEVYHKRW